MKEVKRKQKFSLARFFDECKMAALGTVMASRSLTFIVTFLIVFVVFGVLISLLSSGTSGFDLLIRADFGGKIAILGDSLLALFGKGRNFWDFLLDFSLTFFQATLIALIVFVYKKRKRNTNKHNHGVAEQHKSDEKHRGGGGSKADSASIQNASIATGLALLGSGCPTCGTTLITPILTSIFSTGSIAIAGIVAGIFNLIAYLLIFWSLKKVGLEAYVIIKDEIWQKEHKKASTKAGAGADTETNKRAGAQKESDGSGK